VERTDVDERSFNVFEGILNCLYILAFETAGLVSTDRNLNRFLIAEWHLCNRQSPQSFSVLEQDHIATRPCSNNLEMVCTHDNAGITSFRSFSASGNPARRRRLIHLATLKGRLKESAAERALTTFQEVWLEARLSILHAIQPYCN
jgi:hypothetical protein